jgi:hypothetical protein
MLFSLKDNRRVGIRGIDIAIALIFFSPPKDEAGLGEGMPEHFLELHKF